MQQKRWRRRRKGPWMTWGADDIPNGWDKRPKSPKPHYNGFYGKQTKLVIIFPALYIDTLRYQEVLYILKRYFNVSPYCIEQAPFCKVRYHFYLIGDGKYEEIFNFLTEIYEKDIFIGKTKRYPKAIQDKRSDTLRKKYGTLKSDTKKRKRKRYTKETKTWKWKKNKSPERRDDGWCTRN